jgi:hypothetical protein
VDLLSPRTCDKSSRHCRLANPSSCVPVMATSIQNRHWRLVSKKEFLELGLGGSRACCRGSLLSIDMVRMLHNGSYYPIRCGMFGGSDTKPCLIMKVNGDFHSVPCNPAVQLLSLTCPLPGSCLLEAPIPRSSRQYTPHFGSQIVLVY